VRYISYIKLKGASARVALKKFKKLSAQRSSTHDEKKVWIIDSRGLC